MEKISKKELVIQLILWGLLLAQTVMARTPLSAEEMDMVAVPVVLVEADAAMVADSGGGPRCTDWALSRRVLGQTFAAPAQWDGRDWARAGGIALLAVGSYALDKKVQQYFAENRNNFGKTVERIGYVYGQPMYLAPAAALIYGSGLLFKNEGVKTTGLMILQLGVVASLTQIPARIIAGRVRPYTDKQRDDFKLFKGTQQTRASFISGHALLAVGVSTILAKQINRPWATVLLYAAAATTPYARLYRGSHWLSDVVTGSVLGYVMAKGIMKRYAKDPCAPEGLMISPGLNGISMTIPIK